MGDFTRRVRNGDVAGPLRRAFTRETWKRAFGSVSPPDDDDLETYYAGIAVHEKLAAIRDVLKFSSSGIVTATTKLRAFVAVANYDFVVTSYKTHGVVEEFQSEREAELGEVYALEEMSGLKITLPGGFDFLPDEVVESIVDGIELPIRVVLQAKPSLSGNPRMNEVQWKEVAVELNLGIVYRFAEDIWDECLWNGYKMVDEGRLKRFFPKEIDVVRAYRVGLARRASLWTSFNVMAGHFQNEALGTGLRLRVREVCGIERRGKRQIVKISPHGCSTDVIRQLAVMHAHAAEPYYGELLQEPLASLGGGTLSALIDAWTVLSCTAQVLFDSVRTKHAQGLGDDRANVWMPEYVPTLQVDALVDALRRAAGIDQPDGRRIVDFFTFRGEPGQEIWAQPFVPVGPNTVAPIFAAIVAPNLRRLVDVWMRQAGVDLARRGGAFEMHIRRLVAEGIARSEVLSSVATSINDDYTFCPPSDRKEQIDLVFAIGNTVFVAEAKCILEPTDAKGIAMHRKTVVGAAEQILRKAKAINDQSAAFMSDMERFGMHLTEGFKVVPLVVVSTCTHVGIPACDVPVIDEFVLDRFLDGELEDIAYQPSDPSSSKRSKTVFYSNAAEAESRAQSYFRNPPQLERFVGGVRSRIVPVHPVSESDWIGYILTLECVAGGVPLSLQGLPVGAIESEPNGARDPADSESHPAVGDR